MILVIKGPALVETNSVVRRETQGFGGSDLALGAQASQAR